MDNGKSALDQMNQILAEKEAVIDKKKQELLDYRKELDSFEKELMAKTKELQEGQNRLREEEIAFKEYKKSEESHIEERWKELRSYEENLQKSMEELLQEKVILQSKSREELEKELEEETSTENQEKRIDLNILRESIGLPTVETTVEKESRKNEIPVEVEKPVVTKAVPEMFNNIQTEIEKVFKLQKPFVLEKTPERLCMKLGTRELRVFDKEPYPEMHLVINYKNAKTDTKLQRMIASAARTNPDWIFEAETNQLVCRMFFKADELPKVLIKKLKECIEVIEI